MSFQFVFLIEQERDDKKIKEKKKKKINRSGRKLNSKIKNITIKYLRRPK